MRSLTLIVAVALWAGSSLPALSQDDVPSAIGDVKPAVGNFVGRPTIMTVKALKKTKGDMTEKKVLSYFYRVDVRSKRTKRPVVCFLAFCERPDTTRHLAGAVLPNEAPENSVSRPLGTGPFRLESEEKAKRVVKIGGGVPNGLYASLAEPEIDASRIAADVRMRDLILDIDLADKLLVWRIELWHDGRLLDHFASEERQEVLKQQEIPIEWHGRTAAMLKARENGDRRQSQPSP